MMLLILVIGGLLMVDVDAHGSGAGAAACDNSNMTPDHGANPMTTDSPYSIELSSLEYTAGGSLSVTISGTESLMGFLVLALPADNSTGAPVGAFATQSNLVRQACSWGVTHSSVFSGSMPLKTTINLEWNAPSDATGNVIFYATFVKEADRFWVKVPSETVSLRSVVTDPPLILINSDGCGSTWSCYTDCEGLFCGFVLKWQKNTDTSSIVDFELTGKLAADENYLAVGLGTTSQMSDVSIIACTADANKNSKVEMFYAAGQYGVMSVSEGPVNISSAVGSISTFAVRSMSCRFTYDTSIAQANSNKWKSLGESVYAFIAKGPYSAGTLSKHSQTPRISQSSIDFLADGFEEHSPTPMPTGLRTSHPSLQTASTTTRPSTGEGNPGNPVGSPAAATNTPATTTDSAASYLVTGLITLLAALLFARV